MIIVGFGLLMAFMKTYAYSALSYTFLINAVVMEIYILFNGFWNKVFNGFTSRYIIVDQNMITLSSYCVGSVLIAFGGFLGRVGPKQLLIFGVIQSCVYAFNEALNAQKIKTFDAGGSTTIHIFGAYFGLAISWMLTKKIKPRTKPETTYTSTTFAMVGTLLLWAYWPAFNYGVAANNKFEQIIIVSNTLYALIGSCIASFILTSLLGKKMLM